MDRYQKFTSDLGDNVTEAIERVRDAQVKAIKRVRRTVPVPSAVQSRLGALRKVVQANYELRKALLDAQRDYALGLIGAFADGQARKRATRASA
jgi:hypothetical protein